MLITMPLDGLQLPISVIIVWFECYCPSVFLCHRQYVCVASSLYIDDANTLSVVLQP